MIDGKERNRRQSCELRWIAVITEADPPDRKHGLIHSREGEAVRCHVEIAADNQIFLTEQGEQFIKTLSDLLPSSNGTVAAIDVDRRHRYRTHAGRAHNFSEHDPRARELASTVADAIPEFPNGQA